mgnify:CR=1 FL=1
MRRVISSLLLTALLLGSLSLADSLGILPIIILEALESWPALAYLSFIYYFALKKLTPNPRECAVFIWLAWELTEHLALPVLMMLIVLLSPNPFVAHVTYIALTFLIFSKILGNAKTSEDYAEAFALTAFVLISASIPYIVWTLDVFYGIKGTYTWTILWLTTTIFILAPRKVKATIILQIFRGLKETRVITTSEAYSSE